MYTSPATIPIQEVICSESLCLTPASSPLAQPASFYTKTPRSTVVLETHKHKASWPRSSFWLVYTTERLKLSLSVLRPPCACPSPIQHDNLVFPALLDGFANALCVFPAVIFVEVRRFDVGRGRGVGIVQQTIKRS